MDITGRHVFGVASSSHLSVVGTGSVVQTNAAQVTFANIVPSELASTAAESKRLPNDGIGVAAFDCRGRRAAQEYLSATLRLLTPKACLLTPKT
jgi:hypothetical protein